MSCSPATLRRARVATAIAAVMLLAAGATPAAGEEKPSLADALREGKTTLSLRYRYEDVVDDAVGAKHARASTLRTVLGYRSRSFRGFSLKLEAENVAVIGNDLYDNGGAGGLDNRVRDRPVVADPAVTEINQALIRYLHDHWRVAGGRQEIALGDRRFVGNDGWRQNHQSFDALRVDSSLGGLRFTYAFVDRVQRISGDSPELAGHLLNVDFNLQNVGKFTLYGYLLDYRERSRARLSTATWGLEFAGERALDGRRSLLYEIERAEQSDHADNPRNSAAAYTRLRVGARLSGVKLQLSWEQLDGGPGGGFATPLANLHEHNGWADRFLETPPAGLEDLSLQLDGQHGGFAWLARYHDFGAESRSLSYGRELDLRLTWTFPEGPLLGLEGARYDADGFASDTDRWMIWAKFDI